MALKLPWLWRKVRRADISPQSRDLFERFGEGVIAQVMCGAFNPRAV
jgi:hypothetical protein